MDVRCEKCLTVYDLDDAKVGDAGLTVKCQECGNLFKVRRRPNTAELIAARPDSAGPAALGPAALGPAAPGRTAPAVRAAASAPSPAASPDALEEPITEQTTAASARARGARPAGGAGASPSGEERGWLLRSSTSGEIARFRELTTLQQWIVERKVTREDEISRGGESWKALGGIAELASFFHVVEQAESVARASQPGLAVLRANQTGGLDPQRLGALQTELLPKSRSTSDERSGPSTLGSGAFRADSLGQDAADGPQEAGEATREDEGSITGREGRDRDDYPRRGRGGLVVGLGLVLVALGVAGYVVLRQGEREHQEGASAEAVAELAQRGRAALLLDTDDGFRRAISALERALELDGSALLIRVDLAEAHITWAAYLGEDARRIEGTIGEGAAGQGTTGLGAAGQGTTGAGSTGLAGAAGAQAARTLRAEAQSHLERARHILEEPTGADAAASPALARAFADLLRVEGAPAPAVERYLQRAAQKSANDADIAYVEGELALREGKTAEALTRLGEAARLANEAGRGMARAHYRLAVLAVTGDRRGDAERECEALLRISAKHDRGRALCTFAPADLAIAARPHDAGIEVMTPPPTDPAHVPGKAGDAALAPPGAKEAIPADYKQLVREGDRLSENGRSTQARKLYERALEVDPRGLAALIGLGYCDLDSERFLQAVDRFNAALAIDPAAGDALVGLAESYKVRGQHGRAIEFYRRYLASHPSGPKAQLAQKNLRDLEAKSSKDPGEAPGISEKMTIKPQDKSADHPEVVLPKPPLEEPPP